MIQSYIFNKFFYKIIFYFSYFKVLPIIPDRNVILHVAEDTMSGIIGILAPRIFGIKTAKVVPTECECDEPIHVMKEKAR